MADIIIYKLNNETYKERCAKLILHGWFNEYIGNPFKNIEYGGFCFMDYPILSPVIKLNNKIYNNMLKMQDDSISTTWSYMGGYPSDQAASINDFIDDKSEVIEELPITVDIVLGDKNKPLYFIFLNTEENKPKIELLNKTLDSNYYSITKRNIITVDVDWLLEHKDIPKSLKYELIR